MDTSQIAAHRTSAAEARRVREQIPNGTRRRSTAKALVLFLPTAVLYLASSAAIVIVPWWPVSLLLALVNTLLLSILFVLGHDACHGAFTPSRRINNFLGRLALLPTWHPYTGWEHAHNHVHHTWTNLRGKDYAWAPITKQEYDRRSPFGRWLVRFYRSWWGFGAYYLFEVYFKRTIFPSREFWGRSSRAVFRADRLLVAAFIAAQAALLLVTARLLGSPRADWLVLLLGQWLPFLFWNWLIGFLIFLHHTNPRVPWFDDRREWSYYSGQIQGTAHVVFPWGINRLIHNIMEHTAHHADPKIPLYELPRAQLALEYAFPNDVAVQHFSMRGLRHTIQTCQLYDFQRHRWLSFQGEPTSGPTIWPLPSAARQRATVAD